MLKGKGAEFTGYKTPEQRLRGVVEEYGHEKHTPSLVNRFLFAQGEVWEEKLRNAGERVSLTISPYLGTQEELARSEAGGDGVIVVPDELSTQATRYRLGLLYPGMRSYSVQRINPVENLYDQKGLLYIEMTEDAPDLGTTQSELLYKYKAAGRIGLTLNAYIIGSQTYYLLNGKSFDRMTCSRLLGSSGRGQAAVCANISPRGNLYINRHVDPDIPNRYMGGRSALEVK